MMAAKLRSKKNNQAKYRINLKLDHVDWTNIEKIFATDKKFTQTAISTKEVISANTKDILKLLAGGAIIGLSFVIPALPMALAPFIIKKEHYDNRYFNQTLNRLKKQKLVKIVEENGQTVVKITEDGRMRALRYKLDEMTVKKPRVWDGKWRIVIFDIPEKYKRMREIFRKHLKNMNFYMLQKSVWVHPYPCGKEIEFLRQVYNVGINVTYIIAEKIEGAENLKEHFDLI